MNPSTYIAHPRILSNQSVRTNWPFEATTFVSNQYIFFLDVQFPLCVCVIYIMTKMGFFMSQRNLFSWFQTFAVFCMLYVFFWVISRLLNFIRRRFGTLCLFHVHRLVGVECHSTPTSLWRWNRVFRNVGIKNSDAGELPRRKRTTCFVCFIKLTTCFGHPQVTLYSFLRTNNIYIVAWGWSEWRAETWRQLNKTNKTSCVVTYKKNHFFII